MKDFGTALRAAYYTAWNNQISNPDGGSDKIPVVDEKLDSLISEHDMYILIGGQSETMADTKSYWAREIDLLVTVVNRRNSTNTKTGIENISDQMLAILFPTITSFGINIASPFKLSYARLTNAEYAFQKLDAGWQISKQLTFKTRITQT
jgi:hypothetical protein